MKLHYLGTAAAEGWPALFCGCDACMRAQRMGGKDIRTRAQAVLDDSILFDLGPDTYLHRLYAGLDLRRITTMLITHAHEDHWEPSALTMRGEPYAYHMQGALQLYGNAKVGSGLSLLERENRVLYFRAVPFEAFETSEGYSVTPLPAYHSPGEEALIYYVRKDGCSLLYAHDTGYLTEDTWAWLEGKYIDLISLDCTHMLGTSAGHHMGLRENILVKQRLLDMGSAGEGSTFVLNHFSHNGRLTHADMEKEAAKHGFLTSYDGFVVTC